MTDFVNLMEIERFALHDGPGIRTTVFLKGCPLKCPWCANPESQTGKKLLMYFANKCALCGACASVCATGAITWVGGKPSHKRELCVGCEKCREACLSGAIAFSGRAATVGEIIAEVLRDKDYYDATGGGMTVSGGEPLAQFEALCALLKAAKSEGISTAVETTAQAPEQHVSAVAKLADVMLIDIKHSDPDKLARVTGADIGALRAGLRASMSAGARVVGRIPVIPGFNADSVEEILAFAAREGVRECHLLPYHTLGAGKYAQIGRTYGWSGSPLDKNSLSGAAEIGKRLGIKIKIGG